MNERGTSGTRGAIRAVVVACGLLLAQGCGEGTTSSTPRPDVTGGPGRVLYLTYCASCHGPGGRGDGRVAPALRTPPPDLTRLYERYGTPLDRAAIADYVDGRLLVGAHGAREMPVWGREFFADAPPSTPGLEHTREHLVKVLVDYLQSIQGEQPL